MKETLFIFQAEGVYFLSRFQILPCPLKKKQKKKQKCILPSIIILSNKYLKFIDISLKFY